MRRFTWSIVATAAALTLALPSNAAAQRRTRSDCRSCATSVARLGFMFQSEWQEVDDGHWRETLTVREILTDTPAAGQLQRGDVILRVNGLVATTQLFWSLRRTLAVGDTIRLRIRRGENERELTLTAAEQPS